MTEAASLREQARLAWVAGDLWTARDFMERSLAVSEPGPDLAYGRLAAAEVARRTGDLSLADEYLTALTDNWAEYAAVRPVIEGKALYTLALVRDQQRNPRESVRLNLLAADEFQREGMPDLRRRALQNAAWSLCSTGDALHAVECLEAVESEGLAHRTDADAYWHQRIGWAHAAYTEGGFTETMDLAADIMRGDDVPSDVQCLAAWLAGRAALGMRSLVQASQLATVALQWAMTAADSRCMNGAQQLMREIAAMRATVDSGA